MARFATAFAGWMWACGWLSLAVVSTVSIWLLVVVYLPVLFSLSSWRPNGRR